MSEKRGYISNKRIHRLKIKRLIGVLVVGMLVEFSNKTVSVVAATVMAIIIDFSLLLIKSVVDNISPTHTLTYDIVQ